jgi:hypothetical protein
MPAVSTGPLQLTLLDPRTQIDRVREIWQQLSAAGAPSYFVSWGWMKTWLDQLPQDIPLQCAVFHQGGIPRAACFLGYRRVARQKLFRSTAYLLNETGSKRYDQLYIEYNACVANTASPVRFEEMVRLLPGEWEEIYLSGVDEAAFPGSSLSEPVEGCRLNVFYRLPSYYVDLHAVARGGNYPALLGSSTRSQLNRTYKLYRERGVIQTHVAGCVGEALTFYEEMKQLHQAAWNARGGPGAFSNPWFDRFHQSLIRNRFEAGEIQLIRVSCGPSVVGILYNLVGDGRVYNYQSGLLYESDNRIKPGYLCHGEAVLHNASLGRARYEFLGGGEEYKSRLSTGSGVMVWAHLQKPRAKFTVESWARRTAFWAIAAYQSRIKKRALRGR